MMIPKHEGTDGDIGRVEESMEALHKIGRAALTPLIPALESEDSRLRDSAAVVMGWIGPDAKMAVPYLVDALDDKESGVRRSVVRALGKIGSAAVPDLIDALKDKDKSVRASAARQDIGMALAAVGWPAIVWRRGEGSVPDSARNGKAAPVAARTPV